MSHISVSFSSVFNGQIRNLDDLLQVYGITEGELEGRQVLFAHYSYEDYSGNSFVLLQDVTTHELYEVNGNHCSCYGLEGQWDMEPTTWEALTKRDDVYMNDIRPLVEKIILQAHVSSSDKASRLPFKM